MTTPRARRNDPRTSHDAAETAARGADVLRARVYRVLTAHGSWLTHDEIIHHYAAHARANDWSHATEQGVRSRVSELYQDGWVERDNPATVRNSRGRKVHQWRAVTDPDRAAENYRALQDQQEQDRPTPVTPDIFPIPEPRRYATEPEHLDALPLDTVIILTGDYPVVFQQTHIGRWATPGSIVRAPSEGINLPARILHIPDDADTDPTQFPTTPEGDQ